MAINVFGTICPTDCNTTLDLPILDVDQNCTSYELYESQLTDIWIKPFAAVGTPFTGWSDTFSAITANVTSIDNTSADNSKSKWLVGKGGVPVPDKTTQELAKFKDRISKRTYTVTFTIDNVSDAHYEFATALQCGDASFTFWYGTTHFIYGNAEGIEPKSVDADLPKADGRDGVEQIVITMTFEAKGDPQRRNNPYA